jgi:hypothetical protein
MFVEILLFDKTQYIFKSDADTEVPEEASTSSLTYRTGLMSKRAIFWF